VAAMRVSKNNKQNKNINTYATHTHISKNTRKHTDKQANHTRQKG